MTQTLIAPRSRTVPTVAPSEPRAWLPHVDALDGLRGIAVLAVVVYHLDPDVLPGGFLGVSVFFTLSGFLITNLLLAEWKRSRRVELRRFWGRRFRRLLPAALVGLVLVAVTSWWWADGSQLEELRGDVAAALAYVANWRFIFNGDLYGAAYEAPSPLLHYWSLAIEEQFYVVVAVIAALLARYARSRRAWFVVFGALAAASMLATVVRWGSPDTNRVYFGSDTRAFELLAGVLLALVVGFGVPARLRRWSGRHAAALVAAGGLAAAFLLVDTRQDLLYRGGLWVVALASVIVILAALDHGPLGRALSWKPLVALGLVSYGVYVFHWPIFVFLDHERTGLDGFALVGLRLAVTAALAVGSYVLLEQPIRARRWRLRPLPVAAVVAVTCAGLLLTGTALDRAAATRDVVATPELALGAGPPAPVVVPPVDAAPPVIAPPLERVLFLGDSLVHQSYASLAARMSAAGIDTEAIGGEGEHLLSDSRAWIGELRDALDRFDPQVVVLEACCGWGTPWRSEVVTARDGTHLQPDTDASWREWTAVAAELTDMVRARGRVVLWVLAPPAQTNGYYGPIEPRIGLANDVYRRVARCRPGVGLVPWTRLTGPAGEFAWDLPDTSGSPVRVRAVDGLHFTPEGQAVLADLTVSTVQAQWTAWGARPVPAATCEP